MDKENLYIVLPCYNEEENIKELIKEWKNQESKLLEQNISLNIVIVDDGSQDNTLKISRYLERHYDNITVLSHGVNKGLGEVLNTGVRYVLSKGSDGLLCIMDADLTHSPYYIHSMIDKLIKEKLDCVIASRYRSGSGVEGLSFFRRFLSYGARIVYGLTLNIKGVRDYTCGYRLYKISALESLSQKYNRRILDERGFACMMELLFKLNAEGFKIGEVPFILKYQLKGGESKMKVFKTVNRSLITIGRLKKSTNEGIF
ncbi:glycosyltransferase family 2 protein [Wukongibacter baidiensis]|uniref:glycosyltransferase family 2 protein n=1 Tax=Wukongibacter baidiensis TaxID=1723361 RepID=UPI003D7F6189